MVRLIKEINPGGISLPRWFTAQGPWLYFAADDGAGLGSGNHELYRSDGTAAGTNLVLEINPLPNRGSNPGEQTHAAFQGNVYVSASDGLPPSLWRSDGTAIGTYLLNSLFQGVTPNSLTVAGANLYISFGGGAPTSFLHRYNGIDLVAITRPAAAGGGGLNPFEPTALGGDLYFTESFGNELWRTDGTAAGTTLVRDINPTAGAGAPGPRRGPSQLTAVSDRAVYFAANDGSSGYELWRSDGSAAGTQRLLDINPGAASSHPRDLIVRGNLLYFTASDNTNGRQLWSTDTLTNATTRLTSSGLLGPSTQFFVQDRGNDPNLAIAGNTLFLSGYSRDGAAVSGYELWGLDLPSLVSLSLPSDAVPRQLSEDGPRVLPIVFRRSGDTSSPLSVNFRLGGKARLGIDYTLREAASLSPTGGSIRFAAGASTATLLLDPSSDTLTEDNETVVIALRSGADYAVASTSSDLVVTLIDNDVPAGEVAGAPIPPLLAPSSAFESRNAYAFAALKADGSVVTWGWAASGGNSSAVASQLSGGVVAFASPLRDDRLSFQPAELSRFTTLEAQGNTRLLRRGDNVAFAQAGSGTRLEITSPWGSGAGTDTSDWQMVAAETIGGINKLLWRNNSANFLHTWTLDGDWNWQASGGADGLNTPQAWALEVDFQVDANRDGIIGTPYTTLEAQGNTKLLRRGDGKAFAEVGAGTRQEITSPWDAPTGSESTEWQMIAAETIAGVNRVLWRNNTANFLHTWRLDADWNWTAASGADGLNTPRAWALEVDFQVDANRDGLIGTPPSS